MKRVKNLCFFMILMCVGVAANAQPNLNFHTFADDFVPLDTVWVDVHFDHSTVSNTQSPEAFYDTTYVGIGTRSLPFVSLIQALSSYPHAAQPGDLVNVKTGVYSNRGALYNFSTHHGYYDYLVTESTGLVVRNSGTREHPIKIFSGDGEGLAIIDGDSLGVGIYMDGREYIIIDGLEVRNCAQNIQAKGYGHGLVIRNCHVHHANENGDCIKVSQMDSVYVQNCELHDPGWRPDGVRRQESLDFVAVNHGHVVNCEVYNGEMGLYAKGGSRDIIFHGNYIHDHLMSGLTLGGWTSEAFFYYANNDTNDDRYEAYRCYAINNVIANCIGPGIEFIGSKDCVAEYNTLWNCARSNDWDSPVMIRPGEIATYWYNQGETVSNNENATFRNNIVANEYGEFQHFIRNNDQGSGVRASQDDIHFYNNLWWSDGVTITDGYEVNHLTGSGEPNSIYDQNPYLLNNPPMMMPTDSSPVINQAHQIAYIQEDHVGISRGSSPDMGAFEYTADYDCNGDAGGTAYIDSCGYCVGGNTGNEPCSIQVVIHGTTYHPVKIYPNPAVNTLNIIADNQADVLVSIVDVKGREMLSGNIPSAHKSVLDVSTLDPGIYFLVIKSEGRQFIRKLMIR